MKEFYEIKELKKIINIHKKMNIKSLSIHINHHLDSREFYYNDIYEIEISFDEISELKFYLMNNDFYKFMKFINKLNHFDIYGYFKLFFEDEEIEEEEIMEEIKNIIFNNI